MQIVADENIPLVEGFFASFGEIRRLPGRAIDRSALADADVLLVRSVTRVTPELLSGTPVRFVGTCTIGTDHLDLPGLAAAGITVASAPGCNARGVVEYVLSCLLALSERTGEPWRDKTVGIIGVGEVGGRLLRTLEALGVRCVCCDPPRAEGGQPSLIDIDQLIDEADVISCHVPLTREGAHPTYHLLNLQRLQGLNRGTWLINSSRGPVVDNRVLTSVLAERADLQVALDVWEHEPEVATQLAALCALATPHIAGYSLDGKLRGTAQIYAAFCEYLQQPVTATLDTLAPLAGTTTMQVNPQAPGEWLLGRALRWVYDVRDDDARMRHMLRAAATEVQRRTGFDRLRKEYPLRREAALLEIANADTLPADSQTLLQAAGFALP